MSQNNVFVNITVCVSSSKYDHESTSAGLTLPANDIGEFPKSVFRMLWQAAVNDFYAQQERLAALDKEAKEKADHEYTIEELKPV